VSGLQSAQIPEVGNRYMFLNPLIVNQQTILVSLLTANPLIIYFSQSANR
jgi:hypothetical protein